MASGQIAREATPPANVVTGEFTSAPRVDATEVQLPAEPPTVQTVTVAPQSGFDNTSGADVGWAGNGQPPAIISESSGASGPTSGLAKGVPTDDAAFVTGGIPQVADKSRPFAAADGANPFSVGDDFTGDSMIYPARSNVLRWVVVVSCLGIAAAIAVVFFGVLDGQPPPELQALGEVAESAAKAQEPQEPEPSAANDHSQLLADAQRAIQSGDRSALQVIADSFVSDSKDQPDAAYVAMQAKVHVTIAQLLRDEAAIRMIPGREAKRAFRQHLGVAARLVRELTRDGKGDVNALIVMADVLRLQGRPATRVEQWLRKAERLAPNDREVALVRTRLYLRDRESVQAERLLGRLTDGNTVDSSGDLRALWLRARVDYQNQNHVSAKRAVDAILAAMPAHAHARVLRDRIAAATAVVTSDPMPPEAGSDERSSPRGDIQSASPMDRYDAYLARADRRAEAGDCRAAKVLYARALDANPSGVAALTGLGYCHIDAREFASAQAKFAAALGISPRYQGALFGIAEAYKIQGLKRQALRAFEEYLAKHPTGARAGMARRQIEKLRQSLPSTNPADDTPAPESSPSSDPPPPPAPGAPTSEAVPRTPQPGDRLEVRD